jgi:hypothetical protein
VTRTHARTHARAHTHTHTHTRIHTYTHTHTHTHKRTQDPHDNSSIRLRLMSQDSKHKEMVSSYMAPSVASARKVPRIHTHCTHTQCVYTRTTCVHTHRVCGCVHAKNSAPSFLCQECNFSMPRVQLFYTKSATFLYQECNFSIPSVQLFYHTKCATFLCQALQGPCCPLPHRICPLPLRISPLPHRIYLRKPISH